jgi:hypothetical protein
VSELFDAIQLPRKLQDVGKCLYAEKALKFVPQLKNTILRIDINGHFTTMRIQPAADNASDCTTILNKVRNNIMQCIRDRGIHF